jgi:hypothetical protein
MIPRYVPFDRCERGRDVLRVSLAGLGALFLAAALSGQSDSGVDSWDALAAKGDRVQACMADDQQQIADPAAEALSLYRQALAAVDAAQSGDAAERMRRGAFRAGVVKRMAALTTKQARWQRAFDSARVLFEQHALDRSEEPLKKANAPPCWLALRQLLQGIRDGRSAQDRELTAADELLARAQSSFDLKVAAQLYQDAIVKYTAAQQLNIDDKRATPKITLAKSQYASISSISGHDVVVLSSPGGAALALRGGDKDRSCPATPCKFQFDGAYFDPKGGNFVYSKRLSRPVVAEFTKSGYRSLQVTLTEGPSEWTGSIPGQRINKQYYYFLKNRFEVTLDPLPAAR